MTSTDPGPERSHLKETWQHLLGGAAAAVRFSQDADLAVLGVIDHEAWAGAINRLQAVLDDLPGTALHMLEDASRELVDIVTASPRQVIQRGGISEVDVFLASAIMLIQGSLVELEPNARPWDEEE